MTLGAMANSRCPARSVNCRDQSGHSRTADGAPRDARTGEPPVSGPIRQANRADWNTPITARQYRGVLQ